MPVNEINLQYVPGLSAIQQLKSSGNLRLVENKTIAKKILEYETAVEVSLKSSSESTDKAADKIYALEDKMCDYGEFNRATNENMKYRTSKDTLSLVYNYNMPLLVKDPISLNELSNSAVNYKAVMWGYSTTVNKCKITATELLGLIKEEYHLGNE